MYLTLSTPAPRGALPFLDVMRSVRHLPVCRGVWFADTDDAELAAEGLVRPERANAKTRLLTFQH